MDGLHVGRYFEELQRRAGEMTPESGGQQPLRVLSLFRSGHTMGGEQRRISSVLVAEGCLVDTLGRASRSTMSGRTASGLVRVMLVALILAGTSLPAATACTSESDLVLTLETTVDPSLRQQAATNLALLHSVASTQKLAAAGKSNAIAQAGLESLRDAYVLLIGNTVAKAEAENNELSPKSLAALQSAVDCLGAIGDIASTEALGTLISGTERTRIDSGSIDYAVPDLIDLQLHSLATLAGLSNDSGAVAQLVNAASLPGEATSTQSIRKAAAQALRSHPEAVDLLFQARVSASSDEAVCAAIDACLTEIGEPAVEKLVAALGDQTWTDEILAAIGPAAVPRVVEELDNKTPAVRYRSLGVLLRLFAKDETAVASVLADPKIIPFVMDARANATYGDERDAAAEAVLVRIGEPAVKSLVGHIGSDEWACDVLASIGADAVPALTTALGSSDKDVRFAAADILVQIQSTAPDSVSNLTADLDKENLKPIAANYAYYIRLGRAGSEGVLVKALNKYGDEAMAVDYLNCGNDTLDAAARKWANNHGYAVFTTPGTTGGPQWGEGG
jgi:hypothetical protein